LVKLAALLLTRTNSPKAVSNNYLTKEAFCEHWARIKRVMRRNKWSDSRILFWDEVYQVAKKHLPKKIRPVSSRFLTRDPGIKDICDIIRSARKAKGLTQGELAKKSGLSQQSISFTEQGYVNISLKTLKKLADALDLRISLVKG
jgi:HTH-type transcriptional regulator/antitoxin HipB